MNSKDVPIPPIYNNWLENYQTLQAQRAKKESDDAQALANSQFDHDDEETNVNTRQCLQWILSRQFKYDQFFKRDTR